MIIPIAKVVAYISFAANIQCNSICTIKNNVGWDNLALTKTGVGKFTFSKPWSTMEKINCVATPRKDNLAAIFNGNNFTVEICDIRFIKKDKCERWVDSDFNIMCTGQVEQ